MHCPFCQFEDTRVIDSRVAEDGSTIRRRRECERCHERFNTFETVEIKLPAIVKSDGRREAFDERKLRTGVERALQKRPVASDAVDNVVREVVRQLRAVNEREVFSRLIGEWVMTELKRLDQVAYVRFASVGIGALRTCRRSARKSSASNATCPNSRDCNCRCSVK